MRNILLALILFLIPKQIKANEALNEASSWLGYHERKNRVSLKKFLKIDPVRVEWCAAFMNSVLKKAGYKSTNSLMARSYLRYGKKTRKPKVGDIAIFKRGKSRITGHVAFYLGTEIINGKKFIKVLGGNQDKKVSITLLPYKRLLAYRTY